MTPLIVAILALCGVALVVLGFALGVWFAFSAQAEAMRSMEL